MKVLLTTLFSVFVLTLMAQTTSVLYRDSSQTNGQTSSKMRESGLLPYEECGTRATLDPNFSPERYEAFERTFFNQIHNRLAPVRIPIRAHIIRESDGTGGLTATQLSDAIARVNSYYINANMEFYLCGTINYINNSQYYDMDESLETNLTATHYTSDLINIYFFNSLTSAGSSLCGYAYFPWMSPRRDVVMMANSCAMNGSTLPHELGHFFGLYHTHTTTNGAELVARTNCTRTGDLLCDTPADPTLSSSNVNSSCQYTGTSRDANGDTYTPNPRNIMSYSLKDCRNLFTPQQYSRMAFYQQNDRAYLTCSGGGGSTVNLTKQTDAITVSGTSVTFTTTLQNSGTASAGAFTVGFYASTSSGFTNRILLGRESFTSLGAAATVSRTRTINLCNVPLSSGTYYVGYFIDDQLQVAESNENDNLFWWSTSPQTITCGTVSRPNLTKQTDALTGTGQNATFDVTIRNNGNVAAGAFTVGFYASTSSSFTNPVRLSREVFTSLGVGATANRIVSYNLCNFLPTNGTYYLGYIIDDQNQITETDETDNTWVWSSSPRTTTCSVATTCTGNQTFTTCSGTITDGSGSLNYSDNLDCSWLIRPSTASSAITLSFTAFATESAYDIVQVYDGLNSSGRLLGEFSGSTIPQSVTARSGSIYVRFLTDEDISYAGWSANYTCSNVTQPNLTSINGGGTFSATGSTVTLTAPITNTGTGAAGAFRVGFYVSTSATFTNRTYLGQSTTINSLAANGRFDVNKTLNLCSAGLSNGTYYVGYIIDDQNQITEINEGDNIWLFSSNPVTINCNAACSTQTLTACPSAFSDGSGTSDYRSNANCSWLIRPTGNPAAIVLNFTTFNTENEYDLVDVYDGASTNGIWLGSFSGSSLPPTLLARSGSMYIRFTSDESVEYDGWTANYSCLTTVQANLTSISNSRSFTASGNSVTLGLPVINNGTSAANVFRVGFYASTSSSFTNRIFLGQSNTVSSLAVNGRIDLSKTINLCTAGLTSGTYYVGYVIDDLNQVSEVNENDNIGSWSSNPISINCGTTCNGTTTLTACPGNFDDGSGKDSYQNNVNCSWLIRPSGTPSAITLSFTSFETEASIDLVKVYDGTNSSGRLLGTFSGSTLPPSVTATTGSMFVTFTTDGSVAYSGWTASYNCTMVSNQPNITANPSYGNLTTLDNNITLQYQLVNNGTANAGAFRVGYYVSSNANFSNRIFLSWSEAVSSLNQNESRNFTKTINACSLGLTDGVYYIGFIIDDLNQITESNESDNIWYWNNQPVTIKCDATCSTQTLTACPATFSDGSGLSDYRSNANCSWLIRPTGNPAVIVLNFTTFNTESEYDFVDVYDGTSTNGIWLGSFSGRFLPPTLSARSGSMYIRFTSDESVEYDGWTANYTCVTTSQANLTSITNSGSLTSSDNTVTLGFPIINTGTGAASAFRVGFYASTSSSFTNRIFLGQSSTVSSLAVNGRVDLSKTINLCTTGLTSGTYYVGYVIDDLNQITEISESDNVWRWASNPLSINCATACNTTTTLTACPGSFDDGSINGDYQNNVNCSWLIRPSTLASSITLSFTSFATEAYFDVVRVYDGTNSNGRLLGTFSGYALPPSVTATTGSMFVTFTTDSDITYSGWTATYKCTALTDENSSDGNLSTTHPRQLPPVHNLDSDKKIQIYPNPATHELSLDIDAPKEEIVQLTFVNELGIHYLQQKQALKSGSNRFVLPIQGLADGLWLLQIQTLNGTQYLKFVKKGQ